MGIEADIQALTAAINNLTGALVAHTHGGAEPKAEPKAKAKAKAKAEPKAKGIELPPVEDGDTSLEGVTTFVRAFVASDDTAERNSKLATVKELLAGFSVPRVGDLDAEQRAEFLAALKKAKG